MQLRPNTVYTGHACNPQAMHALGILERRFARPIEILKGEDPRAPVGCTAFVTADYITYPSRYLRVLKLGDSATERQRILWAMFVERMPWLVQAGVIVAINPARANGPNGSFLDDERLGQMHLTGFMDALGSLCGHHRQRTDPLDGLSPTAKRATRIAAGRAARRDIYA
jgi:hypothetical protein